MTRQSKQGSARQGSAMQCKASKSGEGKVHYGLLLEYPEALLPHVENLIKAHPS